jgi:hypothetical protein
VTGEWSVGCSHGSGVWRWSEEMVWMSTLAVYLEGGVGGKL